MIKKLGDLTLREVLEIRDRPCPTLYCKECKERYNVDYAICKADIEYDSDHLDLEEEVEVEE